MTKPVRPATIIVLSVSDPVMNSDCCIDTLYYIRLALGRLPSCPCNRCNKTPSQAHPPGQGDPILDNVCSTVRRIIPRWPLQHSGKSRNGRNGQRGCPRSTDRPNKQTQCYTTGYWNITPFHFHRRHGWKALLHCPGSQQPRELFSLSIKITQYWQP